MIVLRIEGMNCGHCVGRVTEALGGVHGVERVLAVDLKAETATLEGDPDLEEVLQAVNALGFRAQLES